MQTAGNLADSLVWAQGLVCLKDEISCDFCAPELRNGSLDKCADCRLKYLAALMSSWYGVARAPSNKTFTMLLEDCCVDLSKYPHGDWTSPAIPR